MDTPTIDSSPETLSFVSVLEWTETQHGETLQSLQTTLQTLTDVRGADKVANPATVRNFFFQISIPEYLQGLALEARQQGEQAQAASNLNRADICSIKSLLLEDLTDQWRIAMQR